MKQVNIHYYSYYDYRIYDDIINFTQIFELLPNYTFSKSRQFDFKNNSALGQRALKADGPFFWEINLLETGSKIDRELLAYCKSEKLKGGYCLPITLNDTTRTIMHFGLGDDGACYPEAWLLQTIGLQINYASMRLRFPNWQTLHPQHHQRAVPLSRREIETMSWIGLGKSSRETSQILGISEHTVNDHVENAVRKLGAVNRTQGVAVAIITGQINFLDPMKSQSSENPQKAILTSRTPEIKRP